jgi:MFS family permease
LIQARAALFEYLNSRIYFGWVVLAVATVAMFASGPGQSHTFSVFVGPIATDLGVSTTSIASAYAAATLIAALGLSRLGRQVDRFGARRVLIVVAILLGCACAAFSAVASVMSLSLGFMFLRFLGQGAMMLGAANLVAHWFSARRGFAMGVMMLGFAASMALHPLLAQFLIELYGWRHAWQWLGALTWGLTLPLLFLFAYDKPEPLGLPPDGLPASNSASEPSTGDLVGITLGAAVRTSAFWIIAAGLIATAMLATSLFFFQVSIFEQHGLDRGFAASMFGLSAMVMAVAIPILGWILDRVNTKFAFSASLVLLSLTLVGIAYVDSVSLAVIYAIIFGINTAANLTFFSYLWAHYFGRKHLGSIQGGGQALGVVGASLGPLPLGIAFDKFGSYDGALRILAILPLFCAVLALFLKTPELSLDPDRGRKSGEKPSSV